jgi:endonuclease/exonuclease/phosphatase (EEP) superfamily protein YafD
MVRYGLLTACVLLGLLVGVGFLGSYGQPFEILSNFRILLAAAALILVVLAVLLRARLSLLVAGAAAAVSIGVVVADLANLAPESPAKPDGPAPITVVWMNIEAKPTALAALAALAEAEGADIVALTEPSVGGLADVRSALPGFACFTEPKGPLRTGTTIIASRAPCLAIGEADYKRPSEVVFIDLPGLRVIAGHPRAPWGNYRTRERDAAILAAAALKAPAGETLLVGDLNASAYSEGLAPLGPAGFKRAGCGAPFSATWREPNPFFGLLIDHAFLTAGLRLISCRVGAFTTSDHAPLIMKVQIG